MKSSRFILDKYDFLCRDIVFKWPEMAGFDPIYNGVDLAFIIEPLLWTKVSRAIRLANGTFSELDQEILDSGSSTIDYHEFSLWKNAKKEFISGMEWYNSINSSANDKSRVLVTTCDRIDNVMGAINQSDKFKLIYTRSEGELLKFSPDQDVNANEGKDFYNAISSALKSQNIRFHPIDERNLFGECLSTLQWLKYAERDLVMCKPDIFFYSVSERWRTRLYLAMYRKLFKGPVFFLQHGFDCEHFRFDTIDTDYLAVWGDERTRRYKEGGMVSPKTVFRTVGVPDFDHITVPGKMKRDGCFLLWGTRPHYNEKYYLPSRVPEEGDDLMNALADCLKHDPSLYLCIKPHPNCKVQRLQKLAETAGVAERILFSYENIDKLVSFATCVISEDSTAALHAMMGGKPLVQAHFVKPPPLIPVANYDAGFFATNKDELRDGIAKALNMTSDEEEKMFAGQQRFIEDFIYRLDGKSTKRTFEFLEEAAAGGKR